jgi:hypothetical protein
VGRAIYDPYGAILTSTIPLTVTDRLRVASTENLTQWPSPRRPPDAGLAPDATERELIAQVIKRCKDISLATKSDSTALEPLRGHVYHTERVQVFTTCGITAMSDKIDLREAWAGVIPIGKGTHRDLVFEYRARPCGGSPAVLETMPRWLELVIDRRRAHAEQQLNDLGLKRQIASAFQSCDP